MPVPPSYPPPQAPDVSPSPSRKRHIDIATDLPDWATFDRDVEKWWELLDYYDVDEPGRASLFALAQHSDKGYEAANDLIGKLVKKWADNVAVRNPSGFIHSSVLNARHKLDSRR